MPHIDWDEPFRRSLAHYQAEVDADDRYQAAREDFFEEHPDASDEDWARHHQYKLEYAEECRAERAYEDRLEREWDRAADMYP